MLKSHIDAIEGSLLETAKVPANAGHTLHRGTPREALIRKFLQGHLSETVAIGSGEIIDADSVPRESRNQIDIVIYKRDFPRLDFGDQIFGFLSESVVATIEVKSLLDKEGLRTAARSAKRVKELKRNIVTSMSIGYQPPSILSYVVAYEGPESMETVHGWFPDINASEGISYPDLPVSDQNRSRIASPSLDAIFLLGKGFIHFGNTPIGFFHDKQLEQDPAAKWAIADVTRGSLLLLFLFLTTVVSGVTAAKAGPDTLSKVFLSFQSKKWKLTSCRLAEF